MPLSQGFPGQPVRTYTVGAGSDKGQLVGSTQPKDLYDPSVRLGVSAADTPGGLGTFDVTLATPFPCADAAWLSVSGTCDTANATIGMVLAYFDAGGNLIAVSAGFGLSTGAVYLEGTRYAAVGNPLVLDLAVADSAALFVTSITGTWDLRSRPF